MQRDFQFAQLPAVLMHKWKPLSLAVVLMAALSSTAWARQYECTILGVYENRAGVLEPRAAPDRAIGNRITVDSTTGIVSGHFGTDGFAVTIIPRPANDGLLTIETLAGLNGSAANRLRIEPSRSGQAQFVFTYVKNWLYITGVCR